MLKYPMKHYSDILLYPIENVHTQFTKKVLRTYPMPSKLWAFAFFRAIVLKDEQKCVGMNCFEQNILFHIKIWWFTKDESWVPGGRNVSKLDTGRYRKYDIGSGKIHHRNKMAERVDIIFLELDKMFRVEQYKLG